MKNTLSIILIYFTQILYADCSDLTQADCEYWSAYCQWNSDANVCEEVGDGGGGNIEYGPYEFALLTETDGMPSSPLYNGALLFYPTNAAPPFKSVIFIPAFGEAYGLEAWAEFVASYGYIGMTIGNYEGTENDYWDYESRAVGLMAAREIIKEENERVNSPLFTIVDTSNFIFSGHSTSGGGAHVAATLDSTINAVMLLNPAVAFVDSLNCPAETEYYCLIPEHLDHNVPTLVYAGETEYEELVSPDDDIYANMWARPQYDYIPETTDKLWFESAGMGHGSAEQPVGAAASHALYWLKYYLDGEEGFCDSVITQPSGTSDFETTIVCEQGPPPPPPVQNVGYLRSTDVSFCMDECGMYYLESEEGEFLTNVINQNNIPNFDNYVNRFVEIDGDTVQCVECTAKNVDSIILSNNCQNPVSCFVDPCTVGSCSSNENAYCQANYCGDCFADYYENNEYIVCDTPSGISDLTGIDFGDCEMALGFGWVNNHCEAISGCGYIVNDVNYSGDIYSSLFECISASTLSIDKFFPLSFNLNQNHPNPFNPKTTISYQLAKDTNVRIIVHDMLGRLVKTLVNQHQGPGYHMVSWNATNNRNEYVSSGLYFYTIQAGDFSLTKKMVLLD